jgi:hypothetical protein
MHDQRCSTFGAARRLAVNTLELRRKGLRRGIIGSHDRDPAEPLDALSRPGRFPVVNFLGTAIGEQKFVQFSPLAAYDGATDRFLILDVARYKYPPASVTASELFNVMNTTDPDNVDKTRGFALVSKKSGS